MKYKTFITTVLVAVMMVGPITVSAQNPAACTAGVNFVDGVITTVRNAQRELINRYRNVRVNQINTITTNGKNKLENQRNRADADRNRYYNQLSSRANTPGEEVAVATFKNNVEELVDVRRSAIDLAVAGFEDDLDGLIAEFDAGVDRVFADHTSTTNSALDEARSKCQAGETTQEVKQFLESKLDEAEQQFIETRDSYNFPAMYEEVRSARADAVEDAIEQFAADYSTEVAQLYAAF